MGIREVVEELKNSQKNHWPVRRVLLENFGAALFGVKPER
jgi:hypothetical protein